MTRYDRRPRRDWDDTPRRGTPGQIGSVRLIGFVVVLAGSFLLLNRGKDAPKPPSTPRVAVDAAIASPARAAIGAGTFTAAPSDALVARIRGGLVVDIALLDRDAAQTLIDAGTCDDAAVFASRNRTDYVACDVNAQGSSRELSSRVRDRLAGLEGRDTLIGAGLDVPQSGDAPTTPSATTPAASTP